ncbi:MAG: hypothetical protein K2Y08_04970 [Alphaproteobacteria bacterium]|nr:hypothetical protein [Alphaproteobacteria bacterium]
MILKKNKFSIVTAFILGTTMLSSMDKAWSMGDDVTSTSSSSASSSQVTVAPRFFLVGKRRVSEEERTAARGLLKVLADPAANAWSLKALNIRKDLIKKDLSSQNNLSILKQGSLPRVMFDLSKVNPGVLVRDLVLNSLEAIGSAVKEDPYDIITRDKSKPVVVPETIESHREAIGSFKSKEALRNFFSTSLPNLCASHSTIIDSLFAYLPQVSLEEVSKQYVNINSYFYGIKPTRTEKMMLKAEETKLTNEWRQHRNTSINALVEAFYFLKEIDDSMNSVIPPSAPEPLSSSSSDSSMPSTIPASMPDPLQSSSSSDGSMPSTIPASMPDPLQSSSSSDGSMPSTTPASAPEPLQPFSSSSSSMASMPVVGSSTDVSAVNRPSVKLNPGSFDLVRDDIKGRGLMTPFSFNSPEEGSFKVSGEGTLFYQVLSKPLMDSFVGQKLMLEAEIKSETAGGYLQYFNGNERVMSDPYLGENGWQKLQLEFTVKDGSRCHIVYPLVMPPKTPGSDIPVVKIRNINLYTAS